MGLLHPQDAPALFPEPKETESHGGLNRNQKVYYHRLGTNQSEDRLVYERPDEPEWGFDVKVSDAGNYAVFHVWHGTDERNRVYTMNLGDAKDPKLDGEVVRLLDDFDASYEFLGNDGSLLYFRTNLDAPGYRVVAIDSTRPEREHSGPPIRES